MKRLSPEETLQKYQPVLDMMQSKNINAPEACENLNIPYSAFISWKRRQEGKDKKKSKVDGRTLRWQKKKAAETEPTPPEEKKFRRKRTPQLVTIPVSEPKKTNMVVMIGESADIFKALQMINHKD